MKIKSIQTKLKLILLTLLCASAVNIFAETKVVDSGTWAESGSSYQSTATNQNVLTVRNSETWYSGTDITISVTHRGASGALATNQARMDLTGGAVTTTTSNAIGVRYNNSSTGILNGVSITTNASENSYGIQVLNTSSVLANDVTITTHGSHSIGAVSGSGAYLELNRAVINCDGLYPSLRRPDGSAQTAAVLTYSSGTLEVNDSRITSNTVEITSEGKELMILKNNLITVTGTEAVLQLYSGSMIVNGGTLVSTGGNRLLEFTRGGNDIILNNVDATDAGGIVVSSNTTGIDDQVTVNGGSGINGNVTNSGSGALAVNLDNTTLTGDVTAGDSATLTLSGSNGSVITGDVAGAGDSLVNITLTGEGTELHGNFSQSDSSSVINLSLDEGALFAGGGELDSLVLADGVTIGYTGTTITVTDNIEINGTITITIDLSELTATGDYDILDWSGAIGNVDVVNANYNFTGAGVEGDFEVKDGQLTFHVTAVPEPTTWFLLGTGLGILLLAARQRRRRNVQS